jgi:hypothetical protein
MNVVVVIRFPEGFVEFLLELEGQGVKFLGPVQGDSGSSIFHFVDDVFKTTHFLPSLTGAVKGLNPDRMKFL